MGYFISVPKTIECVVAAVLFAAVLSASYLRPLGIMQSLGYGCGKTFGWARKKNNAFFMRETLLFMLCALSYSVIALCFSFAGEWAAVAALSAYILFFALYAYADNKLALRTRAVFTLRLKRLYVISFLFTAIFSYLAVSLLNFADYLLGDMVFSLLRYLPLSLFALLPLPIIALSNLVASLYELPHNRHFIKKASEKLAEFRPTVIGITGSYGKTSVKRILSFMLSAKYRVIATPASFNTPMGVARAIKESDLSACDVFIAEMGARRQGDIAELCKLFPPDYALITGICPQHIETFLTESNLVAAKAEILPAAKKTVISSDCFEKFSGFGGDKVCADCVSDIVLSPSGTEFTLTLGGESARVHTKLLGAPAARNIGTAAAMAHILGLTLAEIATAAEGLEYVEHRLCPMESNGITILDDGYNSNPEGAAAALEVLRTFGGGKIVVTPGLVELGVLGERENYALGQNLVGLDHVILVGETLLAPIKRGYLEGGGEAEKLSICPTLAAAQELIKSLLKSGDAVLFLNDLPDTY